MSRPNGVANVLIVIGLALALLIVTTVVAIAIFALVNL